MFIVIGYVDDRAPMSAGMTGEFSVALLVDEGDGAWICPASGRAL